ncbi:MAG: Maf family protein [Bacillota bacterium]
MVDLVLASASPRRRDLLEQIGAEFRVVPSQIDEEEITAKSAAKLVQRLATAKAKEVAKRVESELVIGADTVVVNKEQVLGKPDSKEEAYEMLLSLRGGCHQVMTGLAIIDLIKGQKRIDYQVTEVKMRHFSRQEIEDYIATGEPLGKAGSYAIQERGAILVTRISGSYTNIVGLPVTRLIELSQELGYQII